MKWLKYDTVSGLILTLSKNKNFQIVRIKYCNVCYGKIPFEDDEFQAREGVAEVYENHFLHTYGSKLIQNVK